ncbi:MAG: DUF3781 domain-containing protein [Paludibacteraceae bacterium]|nr:DUF3781 domain-containing protein [Paludibacteraceae bacterium]
MNLDSSHSPRQALLQSLSQIHTTPMGDERIKRNLRLLDCDVVAYCKEKIASPKCEITQQGKNYYCRIDDIVITVNSFSFTIITAHINKQA